MLERILEVAGAVAAFIPFVSSVTGVIQAFAYYSKAHLKAPDQSEKRAEIAETAAKVVDATQGKLEPSAEKCDCYKKLCIASVFEIIPGVNIIAAVFNAVFLAELFNLEDKNNPPEVNVENEDQPVNSDLEDEENLPEVNVEKEDQSVKSFLDSKKTKVDNSLGEQNLSVKYGITGKIPMMAEEPLNKALSVLDELADQDFQEPSAVLKVKKGLAEILALMARGNHPDIHGKSPYAAVYIVINKCRPSHHLESDIDDAKMYNYKVERDLLNTAITKMLNSDASEMDILDTLADALENEPQNEGPLFSKYEINAVLYEVWRNCMYETLKVLDKLEVEKDNQPLILQVKKDLARRVDEELVGNQSRFFHEKPTEINPIGLLNSRVKECSMHISEYKIEQLSLKIEKGVPERRVYSFKHLEVIGEQYQRPLTEHEKKVAQDEIDSLKKENETKKKNYSDVVESLKKALQRHQTDNITNI